MGSYIPDSKVMVLFLLRGYNINLLPVSRVGVIVVRIFFGAVIFYQSFVASVYLSSYEI